MGKKPQQRHTLCFRYGLCRYETALSFGLIRECLIVN
jgi:hypothetical protein